MNNESSITIATGRSDIEKYSRKVIQINANGNVLYYKGYNHNYGHYFKGKISQLEAKSYIDYVTRKISTISITDSVYSYLILDATKIELNISSNLKSTNHYGYLSSLFDQDTLIKIFNLPEDLKLKQTNTFKLNTKIQNEILPPAPIPKQLH